jgi:hypothetical protein
MTLYEFAELCDVEIHVYHSPGAVSKWIANFKDPFHEVFFKESEDDIMARYTTGWGETPQAAMMDLIKNMDSVKYLVAQPGEYAKGSPRRKYKVPKDLKLYD